MSGSEKRFQGFISRNFSVVHPESGRYLEIYSDQPGVQLYTGNGLPQPESRDPVIGKGGVRYQQYGSFSLETQNYPDAVNHVRSHMLSTALSSLQHLPSPLYVNWFSWWDMKS